jgi:rubredoxin
MENGSETTNVEQARAKLIASIETGLASIDGKMSPLSKELLKHFKAKGVDMTSWWAMTPSGWTCPGCGRVKKDIARLNRNGDLMCRLVEHHDHTQDLLAKRFSEISSSQSAVLADKTAENFAKRSATMIAAYENTIVCDDCNSADAKAKKLVGTEEFFSFSPQEIRRFVIATPNKPHEINQDEAQKIWSTAKPIFELHLKIANRIAQIAATNEHWYQEGELASNPSSVRNKFRITTHSYGVWDVLDELCGRRPSSSLVDASAWRKTVHRKFKKPTIRQIEHLAKVSHSDAWAKVPDDWACPACRRQKSKTVRLSERKGTWTVAFQSISYRDPEQWGRCKKTTLCLDCGWTATQLGKEAAAHLGVEQHEHSIWVELDDVARIVVPRDHARHAFRNDDAQTVVEVVAARIAAARGLDEEDFDF